MTDSFADDDSFNGSGDREPSWSSSVVCTGPPIRWLAGGLAAVVVGVCAAWSWGSLPLAVIGWVLAGPVGLTLIAWFVNRDNAARSSGGVYQAPTWVPAAYWICVALSLIGIVAVAIRVAEGVGRL